MVYISNKKYKNTKVENNMHKFKNINEAKEHLQSEIYRMEKEIKDIDDDFFTEDLQILVVEYKKMLNDNDFLIGMTK